MQQIKFFLIALIFCFIFTQCDNKPKNSEEQTDSTSAEVSERPSFKVAWSIYAGWMPWDYAAKSGILKKWADQHNIDIELVKMDYIPSIEAYVAQQVDACTMTNMEALDMPAAAGITSTALIVGDYSNGNDAILTRENLDIKGLKGQEIYLVELSVSHYLLTRALESVGLSESDVTVVNTSDSDIAPAFLANTDQKAVVTWNPLVMNIEKEEGISNIYSSAAIPGEVLDLMIVNAAKLKQYPQFGKALAGAWYEVMSIMQDEQHAQHQEAIAIMAESAGATVEDYKAQLATTAMYYAANEAKKYTEGTDIKTKMDQVRTFCFDHGLLGEGASSADEVGISYPDGTIQGDEQNIQLIFDSKFMVNN